MDDGAGILLYQYGGLTRTATMSPPCGKVQMALRFKGLPFAVRNLAGPAQARRVNPRGRLPALRLDGRIVVDSSDILDRLEELHPRPALDPSEPRARAQAHLWEDWADECFYFHGVWARFAVPANLQRVAAILFARYPAPLRPLGRLFLRRMMRARLLGQGLGEKEPSAIWRELDEGLGQGEAALGAGPFLLGDQPTRADLAVVALLDQFDVHELAPEPAALLRARQPLMAWRSAVHARCGNAARGGCLPARAPEPGRGSGIP
jgi:glutathione S-transferase